MNSKIQIGFETYTFPCLTTRGQGGRRESQDMVVFTAAIVALLTGATVGVPAGGVALALSRVMFVKRDENDTVKESRSLS